MRSPIECKLKVQTHNSGVRKDTICPLAFLDQYFHFKCCFKPSYTLAEPSAIRFISPHKNTGNQDVIQRETTENSDPACPTFTEPGSQHQRNAIRYENRLVRNISDMRTGPYSIIRKTSKIVVSKYTAA